MEAAERSKSTHDPEVVSLIHRRLPQLGLFVAGLSLFFDVLRLVGTLFAPQVPRWGLRGLLHALATTGFALLWLVGRSSARSLTQLRQLEVLAFAVASFAYSVLLIISPAVFRPELPLGLVLVLGLLVRGVYVPSTVPRSVGLALLVGLPFLGSLFYKYLVVEPLPVAFAHGGEVSTGAVVLGFSTLFWLVSSVVAAGTSHVIYGLQRQVTRLRQLGQYVLGEKLGEGGMGVVYRAQHALLRRPTAIKLLPPEKLGANREQRFEREVQLTARLSHPNTVTVFDFGRTPDGVFYYAMELLEGADLGKLVELAGPLPPARAAKIMADVAGALAEAHDLGLIHRDIKTANIMICWRGGKPDVTKVLDFGLAKDITAADDANLTGSNVLTGTPLYMAPEMVTDPHGVAAPADLYALGCVGYYLLCGEPVFAAETAVEIAAHHVRSKPLPISQRSRQAVPAALEQLVMSCLEKNPARRPASARQLEGALLPLAAAWTPEDAQRFWAEYGDRLRPGGCRQPSRLPGPVSIDMDARKLGSALQGGLPERNLARASLEMARESREARRSSATTR